MNGSEGRVFMHGSGKLLVGTYVSYRSYCGWLELCAPDLTVLCL